MTRETDQHGPGTTQSQNQGAGAQTQSQGQGTDQRTRSQGSEGEPHGAPVRPNEPVVPPRRGEGPDEHPDYDSPTNFGQRADDAARRLKSSSANKSLEHDADRGQEGNKTQRDQEDKLSTSKDRTPPLQSPQDDLA